MSQIFKILVEQLNGLYLGDLIIALLIAILVTILARYIKARNNSYDTSDIIKIFLGVFYLQIILLITIIRREPGNYPQAEIIVPYIELGSISGNVYMKRQAVYSLFNVCLFVPMGVILGYSWTNNNKAKNFIMPIMAGFLLSFAVEITQLITKRGVFELTDILTNIVGTAIGVFIVRIIRKVKK